MALESFFLMGAKPLVEDSPTWKGNPPKKHRAEK